MDFFGVELFGDTKKSLINFILNNLSGKEKKAYYALNPDCFLKYLDIPSYKSILTDKENLVYVDGMGIIFAQKFLRKPQALERIATTDLFPELVQEISKKKMDTKIYLLGGEGNTAERVIENFNKEYPDLNFVGWHNGYFNEDKEEKLIEEINNLEVDILFVGFGCPKQEIWVNDNKEKLKVKAFITCGGLFDYYSGNVKRAPLFMRNYGFEWLFRLLQEPKRLFRRYIFGNMRYINYIILKKLKGVY